MVGADKLITTIMAEIVRTMAGEFAEKIFLRFKMFFMALNFILNSICDFQSGGYLNKGKK